MSSTRDLTSQPYTDLYIGGAWVQASDGGRFDVLDPATGRTLASVEQDFQATLLLTNLESVICREAQAELEVKGLPTQLPRAVNRAVSFNALKNQLIDLLRRQDLPVDTVLDRLRESFCGNPVHQRPGRQVPRQTENARRSLNFLRYKKKIVF